MLTSSLFPLISEIDTKKLIFSFKIVFWFFYAKSFEINSIFYDILYKSDNKKIKNDIIQDMFCS